MRPEHQQDLIDRPSFFAQACFLLCRAALEECDDGRQIGELKA
jgi:hypothetical protein